MSLTTHPEGSVRELWRISYPMMLASFSVMMMLVVDRALLARYSQAALNATVTASTLGWALIFGWLVLGNISEVFVAQYNGAKKYHRIAAPVWQMIWIGLTSFAFFLPLTFYGSQILYSDPHSVYQREYFGWMVFFGPSYPIYGALTGFFVGRGQVHLITILSVVTNIINAVFDYLLIFGVEGWIPSLGVAGAAIATSLSMVITCIILFIVFLNKTNRERYNTGTPTWEPSLLFRCLQIGFPSALFVAFEMMGWALFYLFMQWASPTHITIAGICQSLVIMFLFFGEGLNKGVSTIVGNFIGAGKFQNVPITIKSGVFLVALFFCGMIGIFYFFADELAQLFLNLPESEMSASFNHSLTISVYLVICFLLFEALRMILMGVLTAAGDTFFLMIAGAISVWLLLVLPIYLGVIYFDISIVVAQLITVLYALIATIIYWFRYRTGVWQKITLTTN